MKTCPNCGSSATYYPFSNTSATAIYCDCCPLSLIDNRKSEEELKKIWDSLPRRED